MKKFEVVKTLDGVIHNNQKDAERHLDRLFGSKLGAMARELSNINKYLEISDYIDRNLHRFTELAAIKADMKLEEDDEG